MNIRPRNKILFAQQGVMFSNNNSRGANWRQLVFENYRLHLLDQLRKYGNDTRYGDWLNEMQDRHSLLYRMAGNNWENVAFRNDLVGQYQHDYRGTGRFGKVRINDNDKFDFNLLGIRPNFNSRYSITNPSRRISGDNNAAGNFTVDNLYSAITDDRRILGREGDWDDESLSKFNSELEKLGWTMLLDKNDDSGYYKLRRLKDVNYDDFGNKVELPDTVVIGNKPKPKPLHDYMMKLDNSVVSKFNLAERENEIAALERADEEAKRNAFREKLISGFRNIAPDALDAARLIGTLHTNNKVFGEMLKGIRPSLQLSYHTYRQVVGDEATKLAYYRRAAQGQTKAAQPFTSDADRQVAYMMEHKRVGDELRAQGDLADNLRIRETSELASLHADANRERDTTVANNNLLEINKANAAKHQLNALKLLADWTNVDQFLMGKQAKLKLKLLELKLLERQLASLNVQEEMLNSDLPQLQKLVSDAWDKYYDEKDPEKKKELEKTYNNLKNRYARKSLEFQRNNIRNYYLYAKSGTKIKYKNNTDKYLYKVSKDVVDHFRRITKMTDDSRVRTLPKTVKLTPHPKAKKMLLGGVAPFYIYRPLEFGGESEVSTSSDNSSSSSSSDKKSDAEKDKLDLIKELFKTVKDVALPIDTSLIYKDINRALLKAKSLGEQLSTDDIASLYLSSMQKLSYLKYSKDSYEKAYNQAVANDALNEIAVGTGGEMLLLDLDTGKIKIGTLSDLKNSDLRLNPLTNKQVLNLRAHSPNLAFNDDIFDIVENGVGLTKISSYIKSAAASLGSQDLKIEGVTEVLSNKIKAGLQMLAGFDGTPDGFYTITRNTKDSSSNIKAALNYIYNTLPKNYKTILMLHSGSELNSLNLIMSYLTSQANNSYEESISPLTGKASDKETNPGDKVKATFNDLLLRGQIGVPREFSMITKDENTKLYSLDARYISQLPKVDNDMSIDRMLAESEIGKILDSRLGITFGDQVINPENLKDIMFSVGGGATVVTLPCKYENGHKVVNFAIKDEFDDAIKEASKTTPVDWTNDSFKHNLANILKQKGLDSLLTSGMLLDSNMLGQFLVVEGYSTDRVKFNKNSKYIEKISNPTKELEERLSLALSTKGLDGKVLKYDVDINDWGLGFLFEGGWDDIYHANIFIPLNNDPISALIGSSSLDRSEAKLLASEYLNYLKLIRAKNTDSNLL